MRPRLSLIRSRAKALVDAGVLLAAGLGLALAEPRVAVAEPLHGIAMHGAPALGSGFKHLPYADPNAPKGGSIAYGVVGTFDSLNPFVLKSMRTTARGMWEPPVGGFGQLTYESLMTRSRDEPFTLYGLLAETVEWDDERSHITFNLDPEARWSDGEPVTVDDVIFSFNLLQDKGRPPYSSRLDKIASIDKTGERSVRFTFNDQADREFPLIVAMSPILPKHATDIDAFGQSTLTPPVTSGPYRIRSVSPGERIVYERRQDYWGRDLPAKRGLDNYDEITVEYFLSEQTQFEAFKKGVFDVYPEGNPTRWARAFDFPAVAAGDVVKEAFEKKTPSGMLGFVFNTRRAMFSDRRVRKALAMLFDFSWANRNLFDNAYIRTESYWQGSDLSSLARPAGRREKALLEPFPDVVEPAVMNGTHRLPQTDGSGRDRKVLRAALSLLEDAGYRIADGRLVDVDNQPLAFELMTQNQGQEKLALAYQRNLRPLGIVMGIRTVDDAQYQQRTQTFDYDMIVKSYPSSLSPGAEQIWRWGSVSRDRPGSFNYAGTAEPALDAMIEAMLAARSREDFEAAVRAFDRVLISGHYVVPLYHTNEEWVARWRHIGRPEATPLYGYQLPAWWDGRAR